MARLSCNGLSKRLEEVSFGFGIDRLVSRDEECRWLDNVRHVLEPMPVARMLYDPFVELVRKENTKK